ncbi:phage tail assembly protein [Photorhabdus luminescens]|uniref:Phage tail assembly protein n=1 Tax=Photorhabdus luminescens subsp. mexicana TaxID=2100167 RepID=A0A4R4IRM2_PHOLU|nr:phage tail assembly protein [Photorhabdus luminescens]TDB43324.1 phage tail assembly protein [Photorhabdus luminescens subsp. mexicana]
MLETTKTIVLNTPIESNDGKVRYEQIDLKEPVLIQVEQFYEAQNKSNHSIAAMRLLISLVSSIPESVLKKMAISDFHKCQEFLLGFLDSKRSIAGNN